MLWFLVGDERLSEWARTTISSRANDIVVSAASVWEMAIKSGLGRLEVPDNLLDVLDEQGFRTLSISASHAWAVQELPQDTHRDPFDRQLVAQALVEDIPIISSDADLDSYGVMRRW